jgi:hypothetical protein
VESYYADLSLQRRLIVRHWIFSFVSRNKSIPMDLTTFEIAHNEFDNDTEVPSAMNPLFLTETCHDGDQACNNAHC